MIIGSVFLTLFLMVFLVLSSAKREKKKVHEAEGIEFKVQTAKAFRLLFALLTLLLCIGLLITIIKNILLSDKFDPAVFWGTIGAFLFFLPIFVILSLSTRSHILVKADRLISYKPFKDPKEILFSEIEYVNVGKGMTECFDKNETLLFSQYDPYGIECETERLAFRLRTLTEKH